MARCVLLLRGINVGTKNSLPMAELRRMLTDIGCQNVQTYVQSGNAVVDTSLGLQRLLGETGRALETYMGRPIPVALRTAEEIRAVLKANPFKAKTAEPSKLCVTFLAEKPSGPSLAPLRDKVFSPDEFKVVSREIYSWHPNGQGRSELTKALAKLPVPVATTRNWNTVLQLSEMLAAS